MNYSFDIVFDKENIEEIVQSLRKIISESGAERFQRCIPWIPERTVEEKLYESEELQYVESGSLGLELKSHESPNNYCLTFRIPESRRLIELCNDHGFEQGENISFVEFGCIWASVYIGKKWGVLSLTAATSAMSHLISSSKDVRAHLLSVFSSCASFILFDKEDELFDVLYPEVGRVNLGCADYYCTESDFTLAPDKMVELIKADLLE
ncbi:MAG: hypothetical protein OQJ89_09010 [Kangiellaceae bacterium]|nr:hypothetical protein [Kangiellaceae bacterium]